MGATKYHAYSKEAIELAEFFKVFSSPARVEILLQIKNSNDSTFTTDKYLEKIDIAKSTLSGHLNVLFKKGVIIKRFKNKKRKCFYVYRVSEYFIQFTKTVVNKINQLLIQIHEKQLLLENGHELKTIKVHLKNNHDFDP